MSAQIPGYEIAIAESYRDAALARLDMVGVAKAFEAVRATEGDRDRLLRALDGQIASAGSPAARGALTQLRTRLIEASYAAERERLLACLDADAQSGWSEWLSAYVGLLESPGRLHRRMARDEWPVSASAADELERIRAFERLAAERRYGDLLPSLEWLDEDERVDARLRAPLLVDAAIVWLSYLVRAEEARGRLEMAQQRGPDMAAVWIGWAEFWRNRASNEPDAEKRRVAEEKTRQAAARARELDASAVRQLLTLGELERSLGNTEKAASLIREGLAAGDVEACFELIGVQLDDARAGAEDPAIRGLIDLACELCVDEDDRRNVPRKVAVRLETSGRVDEAIAWRTRAVEAAPDWPMPHVELSQILCEAQRFDEARAQLERAIELAPTLYEAWDALAWTAEGAQDYDEALEHWRQALQLRPTWEPEIRGRMSSCLLNLGRLDDSEREALAALRAGPRNAVAVSTVRALAEASYMQHDDDARAARLLEALLDLGGDAQRADYHNMRGNHLYYRSDFSAAAEQFEQAVQARPGDEVLWSNLAAALERVAADADDPEGALGRAVRAWEQALELAPQQSSYRSSRDRSRRRLTILRRFGEDAVRRVPAATAISVAVTQNLVPALVDEGTGDLTEEVKLEIEAMRRRVREDTGVKIPGVRFRRAEADYGQARAIEIFVLGVQLRVDDLGAQSTDTVGAVLARVESVARSHLAYFLDRHSVLTALQAIDDPQLASMIAAAQLEPRGWRALGAIAREARALAARAERVDWAALARRRLDGLSAGAHGSIPQITAVG